MTANDAWEAHKDDVFNVVADIEVPSERIRYAFLAGYCVAAGLALVVETAPSSPAE